MYWIFFVIFFLYVFNYEIMEKFTDMEFYLLKRRVDKMDERVQENKNGVDKINEMINKLQNSIG